jgi:chemotaxis protein MotB
MARRARRSAAHGPSHERWLISYADFITLLFAFFVVMFAISQSDRSKPKYVSYSVKHAIDEGGVAGTLRQALGKAPDRRPAPEPPAPPPPPQEPPNPLAPSYKYLKSQLEQELNQGKVQLMVDSRGIVISLREKAFFSSGGEEVEPQAYGSIGKIAVVLGGLPNAIRLEGHTDSRPINTPHFRNNWELSSARAISVLMLLESKYGIPSRRFAVAGYADNAPVAGNDEDEGRARNRRVDIVILDKLAAGAPEPDARTK